MNKTTLQTLNAIAKDKQFWHLLSSCLPDKTHEETAYYDEHAHIWMTDTCITLDRIYFDQGLDDKHAYINDYASSIKECYLPYEASINLKPETDCQRKCLNKLQRDGICSLSMTKSSDYDIPVLIILNGNGHITQTDAYMKQHLSKKVPFSEIDKEELQHRCDDKETAMKIIESAGKCCSDLSSTTIGYMHTIKNCYPEMLPYIFDSDCWDGDYLTGDPFVFFLSEKLLKDKDVVRLLLKNGHLDYSPDIVVPTEILDEWETALYVADDNSHLGEHVNPELLSNEDFIIESLDYGVGLLMHMSPDLKNNKNIAIKFLSTYGDSYGWMLEEDIFKSKKSADKFMKTDDAKTAMIAYAAKKPFGFIKDTLNQPDGKDTVSQLIADAILLNKTLPIDIPKDYSDMKNIALAILSVSDERDIVGKYQKLSNDLKQDEDIIELIGTKHPNCMPVVAAEHDKPKEILWYMDRYLSDASSTKFILHEQIYTKLNKEDTEKLNRKLADHGIILPEYADDEELVTRAVHENANSIYNASERLQNDRRLLIQSLSDGDRINKFSDFDGRCNRYEIWKNYMEKHPDDTLFTVNVLMKTRDFYTVPITNVTEDVIKILKNIAPELINEATEHYERQLSWSRDDTERNNIICIKKQLLKAS